MAKSRTQTALLPVSTNLSLDTKGGRVEFDRGSAGDLKECTDMVESFLQRYHYHRPHLGLGMRPPLMPNNSNEADCRISTENRASRIERIVDSESLKW